VSSMRLAVMTIHGMGSQQPGFSTPLHNELKRLIGPEHVGVVWEEVFWADITAKRQQEYLAAARADYELDYIRIRNFVVGALGDAVAYQRVEPAETSREYERVREMGTYLKIHERIASVVKKIYEHDLGGEPVPLVVLAHSLGGHIFTNYYWDVHHQGADEYRVEELRDQRLSTFERLDWTTGIVTFGCNIPLFTFALDEVVPIDFPPPRLSARYKEVAQWLNLFDPDDVLGYPLKPISPAYEDVVTEDIPIDVGNPFIGWTPVSHTQYWTDNDLTRRVADLLKRILAV
jgi:hypothetical protein